MLKRIRALSAADLGYRLRRRGQLTIMRWRLLIPGKPPFDSNPDPQRFAFCRAPAEQLPALSWRLGQLHSSLDSSAFALPASDWQATAEGLRWPLRFFNAIDTQADRSCGDVQTLWHRSRLQGLVTLGLIARHGDDAAVSALAAATLPRTLNAWRQQNPWLRGVNYQSTMECALRLIAVCHAFDLSRQRLMTAGAGASWEDCLWLIRSHTHFIERRLCRFSATGNHSVIEAGGLVYSAVLFSELPGSRQRLCRALTILDQESAQIRPDGGNREQSLCYLRMMAELYELLCRLLAKHSIDCPASFALAANRGNAFLRALTDGAGTLPPVGDSDDGRLLSPYLDLLREPNRRPHQPATALTQFVESGYSLIQSRGHGSARFSHGSLGSTGYFGHGHADALSVCWAVDGKEILVDPGTYRYHGDRIYRRYFRGTSAHNTVTVDNRDQALQGRGDFDWIGGYRAETVWRSTDSDRLIAVLARHDGYAELGLTHWRGLALIEDGLWAVWDRVVATLDAPNPNPNPNERQAALRWHVDADLNKTGHGWQIEGLSQRWHLGVTGGAATLHRGDEARPLGWISRRYSEREPLTTLEIVAPVPAEFLTLLHQTDNGAGLGAPQQRAVDKTVGLFAEQLNAYARSSGLPNDEQGQ